MSQLVGPNNFEQERVKLNALILVTYRVIQKLPDNEILKVRLQETIFDILKLAELAYFKNRENINKFTASIKTLINYFELAQAQNWIEDMNFIVLKKSFSQFLAEFENELFSVSTEPAVIKIKSLIKNTSKSKIDRKELNKRQLKILEHLQQNRDSEVAQLADLLPAVSKRTIRRDLDALINHGLAKKKGKTNGTIYELT